MFANVIFLSPESRALYLICLYGVKSLSETMGSKHLGIGRVRLGR